MRSEFKKRRLKKLKLKRKQQRKRKIVLQTCFMIGILGATFLIVSKFESKKEQKTTKAIVKDEKENEVESLELDNSGYLTLEKDKNAEDAVVVSENTNALVTGKKSYPVRSDGKKVAYLTFDDGPSKNTSKILKILDRYSIKGTFFVLGNSIEKDKNANILKDIVKQGHAIGNHTYSHNYGYLYPNGIINSENFMKDIEKNNELMKSILGKDFSTRVIRFPGGYWTWEGREVVKEKMLNKGYVNIFWNALNGDAEDVKKDEEELFLRTKETVEGLGEECDSIVLLMHDNYGKESTVNVLPRVIEYLQSKGFEFKSIK